MLQGIALAGEKPDPLRRMLPSDSATAMVEKCGVGDPGLSLGALHTNAALYAELERLDRERDTLELAVAGHSLEGRPLYRATVGHGPRTVMIVTQQHGDEPLGTEAALGLLETLSRDSDSARALRENVTVVVMPRVNPDGWARWQRQAAGMGVVIDPRRNSAHMDLNRSYDPEKRPDPAKIPEAMAVLGVVDAYRPDLFLDYHQQNNYLGADGELDSMSVRWASSPDVAPEVAADGQRAAAVIAESLGRAGEARVSLYPANDNPHVSRNGLALAGTPTLLIEQRGLREMERTAEQGLKKGERALPCALLLEGLLSMRSIVQAMADGSLRETDPASALLIERRGEKVNQVAFATAASGT
ncbi:M14 family zinc carboxypeptidase [Halomonas shantousis]